jgi:8-oxo-dGTP diphosphatase
MKFCTLGYIFDNEDVLMLYRNKKDKDIHEGKWSGLGGKVEPGESPRECIIREIKEEANLDVELPRLKSIITFPDYVDGDTWIVFIYRIDEFKGELIQDCPEGELAWKKANSLNSLNMWEGDKVFIKTLFEDNLYEGKFMYKNGKLQSYVLDKV